jgi:hypothetical protein
VREDSTLHTNLAEEHLSFLVALFIKAFSHLTTATAFNSTWKDANTSVTVEWVFSLLPI